MDNTSIMVEDAYKKAFKDGVEEFYRLSSRRDELTAELEAVEDRMERVRQGTIALARLADMNFAEIQEAHPDLFDGQPDLRLGITDAVREVLKSAATTLPPIEIRNRVFQISPAVAGHKSPMASIHAVLRRLIESGEV